MIVVCGKLRFYVEGRPGERFAVRTVEQTIELTGRSVTRQACIRMAGDTHSFCVRWEDIYDTREEADKRAEFLNDLYFTGFGSRPFLDEECLIRNKEGLVLVEEKINAKLSHRPNYGGVWWSSALDGSFFIHFKHRDVEGHNYPGTAKIKEDLSNYDEVLEDIVTIWEELDTPENVEAFKMFLKEGAGK